MFFIASKILGYLISPFIWGLILIIISFFYKRKLFLRLGLIVLLVFSNTFLFRCVIGLWEPPVAELPSTADTSKTVVLLGGYASYNDEHNRIRFFQSSDRLMQALLVMQKNHLNRLVLTGGTPNLVTKERPEAAIVEEFISDLKLNHIEVMIDSVSRNTHENAVETGKLMDSLNLKKDVFLVTSSWHLRRAIGCFEKEGFNVTPVTSDPMGSIEKISFNEFIVPSAGALCYWDALFREWIGIIAYKMKGYI